MSNQELTFDLVLRMEKALAGVEKLLDKSKKTLEKKGEEAGKAYSEGFTKATNGGFKKAVDTIGNQFNKGLDVIGRTSLKTLVDNTEIAILKIKQIPDVLTVGFFKLRDKADLLAISLKQMPEKALRSFIDFKNKSIASFQSLVKIISNFDIKKAIFTDLPNFAKKTFADFGNSAKKAFSSLYTLNLDKIFGGSGGFSRAINNGIQGVKNFGSNIATFTQNGLRSFSELATNGARSLSQLGGNISKGFGGAINGAMGLLQNLAGMAGNIAKAGLFGGAIAGIGTGAGLLGLTKLGTDLASKLQGARISFETMLGGAENAKSLLTDITKFAKNTPFNRMELIDLSSLLVGSGILQKEVIPTLTKLGNVAAGSGAPIENLAYNYAQIKANNRAYTIDLKQFATYGVPIFDKIAKNMGITVETLRNGIDSQKIKVDFKQVEKALNGMTSAGGQYFDLMGKKSNTFEGALSNIQDVAQSILLKFMGVDDTGGVVAGGFFDMAQTKALAFKVWLEENGETIGRWGEMVFTKIGQGMQLAWDAIIQPALADFKLWFDNGGKEAIRKFLSEGWEKFSGFLTYFGNHIWPKVLHPALEDMGKWLADEKRIEDIKKIANAFMAIVITVGKVVDGIKTVKNALGGAWDKLNTSTGQAEEKGWFGGLLNKRANGGPVEAGKLYEVGENNKAEMFMSKGKQYMIPGNRGQVLNQQQIKTENRNQINSGNTTQYIYQEQYKQPSFSSLAYNY